jgi:hypothetical protein
MDGSMFDDLVRRLTRRTAVRVVGGGALASLGTRTRAANNRRDKNVHRHKCIPAPKSCVLNKKKAAPHACKRCCQSVRSVSATKGVCCTPNGWGCSTAAECCLGVCSVGLCQNEVIQLPPLPPPPPDPPPCVPIGLPCMVTTDCCLTLGDAVFCNNGVCST